MGQTKYITENFGKYKPGDLSAYIKLGGFTGLKRAMKQGYEQTIDDISKSKLQGRGGANYPTGKKLAQAREAKGDDTRYLLCNADEGEPGTFKDKFLLTNGIFQVIEGIIIAAYCANANKGYIYVREEYSFMHKFIEDAIKKVYAKGLLGDNIFGTGFNFELSLFSGGGSYICGEGFAMCESIEGKSGRPRSKPPYVKQAGVFMKPTLVINVETVSVVSTLMRKGFLTVLQHGTRECPGTKMISVSGHVAKPGVYEVDFGTTLKEILMIAGGPRKGSKIKFLQIGGASGGIVPVNAIDTPYTYDGMQSLMSSIGSGAIVVGSEKDSVVGYLRCVTNFFLHESCGKCVPCREGNRQLIKIMNRLERRKGTVNDLKQYIRIINALDASLCGSGRTQVVPFVTAYKFFAGEFKAALAGEVRS